MVKLWGFFGSSSGSTQAELPLAGFPPASSSHSHQQSLQLHTAKFCSITQCTLRSWLFFFLSLFFFFLPLSPPSIWSTSEHLPRVSGKPGSGRCSCGCNFYPAQLWDLIRAHASAQEWVNAPTSFCLITTRDVIRIIHVMTTRRIWSCAQSQPKTPTDSGNAWI